MFKWFGRVNYTPYTKVSDFARHLKNGRLMGSRCRHCGATSFPPKADCDACMSGDFEFVEVSGAGTLVTFTKIVAAPTGFEDVAPYNIGVLDLADGGRALAWLGETVPEADIAIGMELQLVPRILEELEEIKVYYTLERPGTTWSTAAADA
ncbi:MAG: Zn-ribbon domain-containing OB-fold protein [Gemmatimonadota bacterium]|nr:Zn-ribbon domain-containing OB-fold protein [Gemmatimonadota bacterium]MDH3369444.1 Zn-ribbon domain-containing OB-fold protein [Gemmatimonadota bacterium]MDH3478772.1 Zn-ribbon domain-containing OB-fold protein [Gemmatimonadota bacterium]MDH3568835.1 Zn-ribbon domain-containing OB-fold protein [Gemmatimonadota bacterium]MDH5549869.1 Zn-ribbon domain-containing OB-fold protein [Gemmatimonadota bacterium]